MRLTHFGHSCVLVELNGTTVLLDPCNFSHGFEVITGLDAILITHQLEEAIAVGDRIVVFGKAAKLLADIRTKDWPAPEHAALRDAIQATLHANETHARLKPQ